MSPDVIENIYKLYIRPNLDYADVIYHKAEDINTTFYIENNNQLMKKIEKIQYHAARIITGAWKALAGKNYTKTWVGSH